MKRVLKILCLALILMCGSLLYACGVNVVTPKISLQNTSIELRIGEEGNSTKSVDVILSDFAEGSPQLNFSTDSAGLVAYSSEYISNGKTRLTITGTQPGTAVLNVRSLQGGATATITVKVIQPIEDFSLSNQFNGKLYCIKGEDLDLKNLSFYSFYPLNTNEKDLEFKISANTNCEINDGVLSIGEDFVDNKITVTAKSKYNSTLSIDFDVKILNPITATVRYGYSSVNEDNYSSVGTNSYLEIFSTDSSLSQATAIVEIYAGTQSEVLNIEKIFNTTEVKFLVSQVYYNYDYANGKHTYNFTIQSNSLDAGKIDGLVFKVSYDNYTIGESDYSVSTNKLNINSYNLPTAIQINGETESLDFDIFENSSNGKILEFTVLPGNLKTGENYSEIRIWAYDYSDCTISLYKYNFNRTAKTCVFGWYKNNLDELKFACDNPDFVEEGETPYYTTTSGTKLYAFINDMYNSEDNKQATLYAQSSYYFDGFSITESDIAHTTLNVVVNPNAQNIYLANLTESGVVADLSDTINIKLGETITQYIAVDPKTFVIGSTSRLSLSNKDLASLGNLTSFSTDKTDYSYATFQIQALSLGSTILKITLSDGKTKDITLNVISPLEELDIDIEDVNSGLQSDIVAFTDISDTLASVGSSLNKISIANSGSTIQFIKTPTPLTAQYYLEYSFYDLTSSEFFDDFDIDDAILRSYIETSNIVKVSSMKNFSIIEALSSQTEGNVIVKIDVWGMNEDAEYAKDGTVYYLINFFVPVSSLRVNNGTLNLYPYDSIGDLYLDNNGQSLSIGTFTVAINSSNGSISPTYIDTLAVYVNGSFTPVSFANNFCYLNENGAVTTSMSNAVLKIIRVLSGNTYTFTVQALKETNQNYVLTLVVTEVGNRKITGLARVFVQDVTEINDLELVNINKNNGIYFNNENNTNTKMSLEVVTNLYSDSGKEITNSNLVFEFDWSRAYNEEVEILGISKIYLTLTNNTYKLLNDNVELLKIEVNESGNYVLTIHEAFSGFGTLKIYPESNYYNSYSGWNGENPDAYYSMPIKIGDGLTEDTAIEISKVSDFMSELNGSNKCYVLTTNLNLTTVEEYSPIQNFSGILSGLYQGSVKAITTNSPIFTGIGTNGIVKNLNIVAKPSTAVDCQYANTTIDGTTRSCFGYLACVNDGRITDVNIEANTNFNATAKLIGNPSTTSTSIYAMGLLVGVNKGTIEYNNSTTETINVYGTNNGLADSGVTYAGGVAGYDYDLGTISGAHVAVAVNVTDATGTGKISGNKLDSYYVNDTYNCSTSVVNVDTFSATLNPRNQDSNTDNDLTASDLIVSGNSLTASTDPESPASANVVLYYYNVAGATLNEDETADLKTYNTFTLSNLLALSYDYSLFNITSSNNNILEVVGESLEINGVGKVTLTITPKFSSLSEKPSISLTIYVLYPINNYKIYQGISVEASNNIIDNNEMVSLKKTGTLYITTSLNNTVVLDNNNLYQISQNKLALQINLSTDFIVAGMAIDYTIEDDDSNSYFGLGTLSVKATSDASTTSNYDLLTKLVLQNKNQTIGNINSTDNLSDFITVNTMLLGSFSNIAKLNVTVGAEKIETSIIGAEIDLSNALTFDVVLTTDNTGDELLLSIMNESGISTVLGDIFEVSISTPTIDGVENKNYYRISIYIKDSYRSRISQTENFTISISAKSNPLISLIIDLTVKPQEIISVTYSHYNRDDSSSSEGFRIQSEPSSILAPGDNGLLKINLYPSYATFTKIVIQSEVVNSQYVLLEQMYLSSSVYLPASTNSSYSSSRDSNTLIIYHSTGLTNDEGMVYIRTKMLETVQESLDFSITITIYGYDEDGNEYIVKTENIVLVSEVIDGAQITINDGDEAIVPRGLESSIQISVPEYQDLANYSIVGKNTPSDDNDYINIYFNRAEYVIVGGRKVYSGTLAVGLNAELTGDGVFEVETIVSKIINGRIENVRDSVMITVVDFLVEGVYIEGNNPEDNVFDTPLAIDKELKFEFILSETPDYLNPTSAQSVAITRIESAKEYFLENMAYRYGNEAGYSYIINTYRTFVKDNVTPTGGVAADYLTYVVSTQAPNSIAYNLYYTSDMTQYVTQTNQYVSIDYNNDGDISDFESNLLKVKGDKIGAVNFTLRIGYKLPGDFATYYITYNFVINVQPYSDEDKPTPIYTEEELIEFLNDENGIDANYLLMDDMILEDFVPFETTNFSSLDGNNKRITIKNYDLSSLQSSDTLNLAFFITVASGSTLKNLTINNYELEDIIILEDMMVDEGQSLTINVAGLAVENYGIVYNCEVIALDIDGTGEHNSDCGIRVYFDSVNKEKAKRDTTKVNIAGLVIDNGTNGCITNSRVGGYEFITVTGTTSNSNEEYLTQSNLNIIGQGNISGFVITNKGVISSSYFSNGNITNKSISGTGGVTSGFVMNNNRGGTISGCYSKGIKQLSDNISIYVTGGGINAQGIVAGFGYLNEGVISDSYSNIKLGGTSTARIVSGFVYNNKNTGLIQRCYSASTIDGALTTQMPFTGVNALQESMQEVAGGLSNCYYVVDNYSSGVLLEEKYSTGAIGLSLVSLTSDKFYGFSFSSDEDEENGTWLTNGGYPELVEANNIAISSRYIIEGYTSLVSGDQSIYSLNVFPYVKGYEYGSAKNPIIIRTADEYNRVFGQEKALDSGYYYAISQMYDKTRGVIFGSYRLVSHIDFNNLTIKENILIKSSIMNLTQNDEYKGVFDGNGLTMSNVTVSLNDQKVVGLISQLTNSAVFKNVNLTVVRVSAGSGVYVGGAVGLVKDAYLSDINVTPVVKTLGDNKSQISGNNIVGGVVGYVVGDSKIFNLTSSISVASLYKTGIVEYSRTNQTLTAHGGLSYAGGVIGLADIYENIFDSSVYSSEYNINKLKFYGENVTVQGRFVGGVVGYVGVSTYLADALFEVTGLANGVFNQKLISYGESIGGLVGVNYGFLYEIRIEHSADAQKAIEDGLKGYYSRTTVFRGNTTLFNAFTSGGELNYIGGLVGKMLNGELTTSYSKIDVSYINAKFAGGLIGYNKAATAFHELYAFGDVYGIKAGGLIGHNEASIQLSFCVAMNFYNKANTLITAATSAPHTPANLGSLIGNNTSGSYTLKNVFAVQDLTIGTIEYTLNAVASGTGDSAKLLTITENDIGKFNKDTTTDTITSNQMFLNAGWDSTLWTRDEGRIFPYLNFGVINQILYIEKPSDLAKIYKYSNQNNTVIFGDDPNTLFDPYSVNGTWATGEYAGLSVDKENKTITFDISKVDFFIEYNNFYFSRFMGTMECENDDLTYVITGFNRTLFGDIIGGSVKNLTFGEDDEETIDNTTTLGSSVLANSISYGTVLEDLTFQNITISSESGKIGIIANSIASVGSITSVKIEDCSITSTLSSGTLYVGAIAGQAATPSTFTGQYTRISISNTKIFVNGKTEGETTTYPSTVNAGLIFGEISYGATYTDCLIKDTNNVIQVKESTTIFAGGYVGSASGAKQTVDVTTQKTITDNLYILIGNCENLTAGLLFGEAQLNIDNNDNITIKGFISNQYEWALVIATAPSLITATPCFAEVGGIVGSGSGTIKNVTVGGLTVGFINLSTKTNSTPTTSIGGAVGYGITNDLTMENVEINDTITINNTADANSDIITVGGAVGKTGNTFNLGAGVVVKSDILIEEKSENQLTVYSGGIIGYSDTSSGTSFETSFSTFAGTFKIEAANKIYAGGIIGTTSDAHKTIPANKITISCAKVSGNIVINSVYYSSTPSADPSAELYLGGIAGYVVANITGGYTWGNITITNGLNIKNLWVGGIVGYLKGHTDGIAFNTNNCLTSIYNTNRATDHLVRALIAKQEGGTITIGTENYYCHQINLCVDETTVGTNLYYRKGYASGTASGSSILDKFEDKELTTITISGNGSKLNPTEITAIGSGNTFSANNYYVITQNITIAEQRSVSGHLVGDGYTLSESGAGSPFGTIENYAAISGIRMDFTSTQTLPVSPKGFAITNKGTIFAVTAEVKGYTGTDKSWGNVTGYVQSGFADNNYGLIADCGVVLNVKGASAGFVSNNTGVISNCYATGVVHDGATIGFSGRTTGKVFNSYTAIKTTGPTIFGGTATNCYYDINATEKIGTGGTSKDTNYMSTIGLTPTVILSSNKLSGTSQAQEDLAIWGQLYSNNFGYPTLSVGAYSNFTSYMVINTGDGSSSNYLQIPNPGKLSQLQLGMGPSGSHLAWTGDYNHYVLLGNIDLANTGTITGENWSAITSWIPIGDSTTNFTGSFDGKDYKILNIPSIGMVAENELDYAGFFGVVSGATIKNCDFIYASGSTISGTYSGGVVGKGDNSNIINITSSGALIRSNISIGGIVGYMLGFSTINSAINYNLINSEVEVHAGGIVGECSTSLQDPGKNSYPTVSNCINFGEINSSLSDRVGGIYGINWGDGSNILDNLNLGLVISSTNPYGLVPTAPASGSSFLWSNNCSNPDTNISDGFADYTIDETTTSINIYTAKGFAYIAKQINENGTYFNYIIWLANDIDLSQYVWTPIGNSTHLYKGSFYGNGKTIYGLGAYSTAHSGLFGRVKTLDTTPPATFKDTTLASGVSVSYDGCAGGLIGYIDVSEGGSMSGITNNATVMAYGQDDSGSNIYAGGIVGRIGTVSSTLFEIENCTNNARIIARGITAGQILNVGGIVGKMTNGAITGCINNGDVFGETYVGQVYAAGIVGYASAGSIINCTNNANISSDKTGISNDNVHLLRTPAQWGVILADIKINVTEKITGGVVWGFNAACTSNFNVQTTYSEQIKGGGDATITNSTEEGSLEYSQLNFVYNKNWTEDLWNAQSSSNTWIGGWSYKSSVTIGSNTYVNTYSNGNHEWGCGDNNTVGWDFLRNSIFKWTVTQVTEPAP